MVEYWAAYRILKDERWPRVCFEQYHEFLVENKLRNSRKHNNSRPVFLLELKMEETSPRRIENNWTSGEEIGKKSLYDKQCCLAWLASSRLLRFVGGHGMVEGDYYAHPSLIFN